MEGDEGTTYSSAFLVSWLALLAAGHTLTWCLWSKGVGLVLSDPSDRRAFVSRALLPSLT